LLKDPAAVLLAYVTFYDQTGRWLETSFKAISRDWASANAAKNL